jgi:hypothetical protein
MKRLSLQSKPSLIHGCGYFPTRDLLMGESFDRSYPDDFRGFNHSDTPTLAIVQEEHRLVALRYLTPNEELTVDYGFDPKVGHCFNCPVCTHNR